MCLKEFRSVRDYSDSELRGTHRMKAVASLENAFYLRMSVTAYYSSIGISSVEFPVSDSGYSESITLPTTFSLRQPVLQTHQLCHQRCKYPHAHYCALSNPRKKVRVVPVLDRNVSYKRINEDGSHRRRFLLMNLRVPINAQSRKTHQDGQPLRY